MYDKAKILLCAKSLVGFRADGNAFYEQLYNRATAISGNDMDFAAFDKSIIWGDSFEDLGFAVGDSIIITLSANNNGTFTIATIADNIITTAENLTDETSQTADIKALSAVQKSISGKWVNDLSSVNYEMISAALSVDQTPKVYIENVLESETIKIMDRFVNRSKSNYYSKELLSNQSIVSGVQQFNKKVQQNARFVGYWIRPHSSNNLKIQLNELGFQADALQENLRVYLYITSQLEPLKTVTFNINKTSSLVWQSVADWILNYEAENIGTGQNYLVGYYEKDPNNAQPEQLQGQALYMNFDCGGCPGSPKLLYDKYMGIYPVEIPNQYLNWSGSEYNIPLVDDVANFVTSQTYGLLAKVNITCDISNVLCGNIQMFSEALQYGVAARILMDAYASNRINPITDSKREQAAKFGVTYERKLEGYTTQDNIKVKGLLDTLTVDFSQLDRYCLPCAPGIELGHLSRR